MPLIIEGAKAPRRRRTKRELATDAQRAEIGAIWAEGQRIAAERLARTSPSEIAKATRLLRKWSALPTAKPKKRATKAVRRIWPGA
jgi:hypothetical protein